MKTPREQIIHNYFNPQKTLDVVDLYAWLSPDISIWESEGVPWGGLYRGLQGVGDYMSSVTRHIISEIVVEEVYSCDKIVVVIGRAVGKVISNGKPFNVRLTQLYNFDENDKINRVDFLADLHAYQEVLQKKSSVP